MVVRRLPIILLLLLLCACRQETPLDLEAVKGRAQAGDADACKQLISLLATAENDINSRVYPAVLEAGERIVPYLLENIETTDRIRREHVIAALGTLKVRAAIPAIGRVLGNPGLERRYVAAWALGEIGDPAGVPPLVQALSDANGEVRRYAVKALIRLNRLAVPLLLDFLPSASPIGESGAVRALGDIGDLRALEPLLARVKGPARQDIFLALGKLKDPRAEAALITGLADADWQIRMNAAMALGPLAGPRAQTALEKTLEDEVMVVREWSARSLDMSSGRRFLYRNEKGKYVAPYSVYH